MTHSYMWPAEWEPHAATWLAWPHQEEDWPGKFEPVPWVMVEIVRLLCAGERVEILCNDEAVRASARDALERARVPAGGYRLHIQPTDRCWLRDSAPTIVRRADGALTAIDWRFNAWAKYDNWQHDDQVAAAVARIAQLERVQAVRPDNGERLVLEGGAIDGNGAGTVLTTETCLLSGVQERNPGLDRQGYEAALGRYLGARKVVWLGDSCVGDDTHGHVDDVARFVAPDTIVLAVEDDPADENHAISRDNLRRLEEATDQDGNPLRVVRLPFPAPIYFEDLRLPASYANFYIGNKAVLTPTFNDPRDRIALNTLAELFPDREVVGVHAVDLIWGLGAVHCLAQQQPSA